MTQALSLRPPDSGASNFIAGIPASSIASIVNDATAAVANASSHGKGVTSLLRRCCFLNPAPSRRAEATAQEEVTAKLRGLATRVDHGKRVALSTTGISTGADVLTVGATSAKFGCILGKASTAAGIISQVAQPAIGVLSSSMFAIACTVRLFRQLPLKRQVDAALAKATTNSQEAEIDFLRLVGNTPEERASHLEALQVTLSKPEAQQLMVIAEQFDALRARRTQLESNNHGIESAELKDVTHECLVLMTKGLALMQRSATQHLLSTLLMLLVNIAAMGVAIALLLNPATGPLVLASIALAVISVSLTLHRMAQDRALVLGKLVNLDVGRAEEKLNQTTITFDKNFIYEDQAG